MYEMVSLLSLVTIAVCAGYTVGHSNGYNEASRKYVEYLRKRHNDTNIFI